MSKKTSDKIQALNAINKNGILLVFPIKNKNEYNSIWKELYPRSKMKWEWDENGDNRVAKLWHLREELSSSREVIYSKWLSGRATFFSKPLFKSLYRLSREWNSNQKTRESMQILDCLKMDSPLSTKQLKEATHLQGKYFERTYEKAMKPLWQHFDIVAVGEIQDSSFPSLAIASTESFFEDLVLEAKEKSLSEAQEIFKTYVPQNSLVEKFWRKLQN
ncbi:MAG: hypothetical protein V4596_11730 [Bdellovibrionota bacterium]